MESEIERTLNMKIAVAGIGYVGLSIAVLLAQHNEVTAVDIIQEKVNYEPVLKEDRFYNSRVMRDLDEFKRISEIILANRMCKELEDVKEKVYTRDIYNRD